MRNNFSQRSVFYFTFTILISLFLNIKPAHLEEDVNYRLQIISLTLILYLHGKRLFVYSAHNSFLYKSC